MSEYKLSTLRDVFETVPLDRIELCMAEIAKGMVYARQLRDLNEAVTKALDPRAESDLVWPAVCTWIDDDKGQTTINLASEGKVVARFTAGPDSAS